MLKLSIENPIKISDYGSHGWARYRIDFENLKDKEYYVLGWVLPMLNHRGHEMESREFLFAMDGWKQGLVKEVFQDDLWLVQRFKVRLYRAGLIPENDEPEVTLLEEQEYGAQAPLD